MQPKTKKKRNAPEILSPQELAFVAIYPGHGGGADAARAVGYKNPRQSAYQLLQREPVRRAIEEKQRQVAATAGKELGKKLAKTDIVQRWIGEVDRVKRLADKLESNGTVDPTTLLAFCKSLDSSSNALDKIAELIGAKVHLTADLTKEFESKSDEELIFFHEHGYWPTVDSERSCTGSAKTIGARAGDSEQKSAQA